jgi:polysaccharide deacetylase 2 family uncharacterized protein YibQ
MTNKRSGRQNTALFILIAASLMIVLEMFILPGGRFLAGRDKPAPQPETVEVAVPVIEEQVPEAAPPPLSAEDRMAEEMNVAPDEVMPPPEANTAMPPEAAPAPEGEPLWKMNAVPPPAVPEGFGRVVIIIDDLGMNRRQSEAVLDLPGPVTTAFLPYAGHVAAMVQEAREKGHEVIIHMPMEPMDGRLDMGSIALHENMGDADFDAMLDKGLNAFDGYVGMNNHMGSRLTQDRGAMDRLMSKLHERGMLFVDSRTIAGSVAEEVAKEHHVPHAGRDIFLDDNESYENVVEMLAKTASVARRAGTAIAIGHPKENTVRALQEWLPTLAARKLVLVPISAVVTTEPETAQADADMEMANTPPLRALPTFDEWLSTTRGE